MNFLGIVLGLVILAAFLRGGFNRDTTDSASERSGLMLYTDHATGVQYVGSLFSGFTVRVDRDGKPYTDKAR